MLTVVDHVAYDNGAAPGANTGIVNAYRGSAITPKYARSKLSISIVLATASIVNLSKTTSGTEVLIEMNGNSAIPALQMYWYEFPISNASTYDVEVETDGIIRQLFIQETPYGMTS